MMANGRRPPPWTGKLALVDDATETLEDFHGHTGGRGTRLAGGGRQASVPGQEISHLQGQLVKLMLWELLVGESLVQDFPVVLVQLIRPDCIGGYRHSVLC